MGMANVYVFDGKYNSMPLFQIVDRRLEKGRHLPNEQRWMRYTETKPEEPKTIDGRRILNTVETNLEYGVIGRAFTTSIDKPAKPRAINDTGVHTVIIPTTSEPSFRRNFNVVEVEEQIAKFARENPTKVKIPEPKDRKPVKEEIADAGSQDKTTADTKKPKKASWGWILPGNNSPPAAPGSRLADLESEIDEIDDFGEYAENMFTPVAGKDWKLVNSYVTGDKMPRPKGGMVIDERQKRELEIGGFQYRLSYAQFVDRFLTEMGVPELLKTPSAKPEKQVRVFTGYGKSGDSVNLLQTAISGKMRRAGAMFGRKKRRLEAQGKVDKLLGKDGSEQQLQAAAIEQARLEIPTSMFAYIAPGQGQIFNQYAFKPVKRPRAVMFCMMNPATTMNGGEPVMMDNETKALARRALYLVHIFLWDHYDNVEIVYLRNSVRSTKTDEEDFFSATRPRKRIVSAALEAQCELTQYRFHPASWDIYNVLISDGKTDATNSTDEVARCEELLKTRILPVSELFAYVEIPNRADRSTESTYWLALDSLKSEHNNLGMGRVTTRLNIAPIVVPKLIRSQSTEGLHPK
jgi:uncharacterized sporulation protein YeaH/YhbH (DUF444 family)